MCWCVIPEDSMLPLRGTTWQISCRLRIQYASGRPFTHNPSSSMLIHGLVFTPALLRSLLTGKVSLHWCPMRNSLKKRDMLHSLWRTTLARYWSDNSLPRWRLQLRFAPSYSWALPRGKYLPATQASHVFSTNLISFSTQLFT